MLPSFFRVAFVEREMLDLARQKPIEQLEIGLQVIGMRQFGPVRLRSSSLE